ncbi:CehA/McbA family metallohydrolase [bacterium]|nr:CehA/McbA family metallohydrolase [bacterium]
MKNLPWLALLLLSGCSQAPLAHPSAPVETASPTAWVEPSWKPSTDPYAGLLCYYGDTHFHSGYSDDNRRDGPPIRAWQSALQRSTEASKFFGPWLGGFFLFVTDHVTYIKTRQDMDDALFQKARKQADDPSVDRKGPDYTFTAFAGAEMTGLRRGGDYPYFDDRFGHLNFFNMTSIAPYVEDDLAANAEGSEVMDRFAADSSHLGQFNHPGYGEEPRTGDDSLHLYPYTPTRDRVFRFIEVNDDRPAHWQKGVSQYNLCLRRGYHVSPVVGTDIHNTASGLTGQARTVIWAPSTLNLDLEQRRQLLLAAARAGRVYATENQTLLLQWSLDGYPMGARISRRAEGAIKVRAHCVSGNISKVELVADTKPEVAEEKIDDERQCTRVLASWKADSTNFQASQQVRLSGVHYLYLRLQVKSGERAVTSPIYLESPPTGNKP